MAIVIPKLHCYVAKDCFTSQIIFSHINAINQHNEFPSGNQFSRLAPAPQVTPYLV